MKFLSIIFFLSLIAFSLNEVTVELKETQSVRMNTNANVKIIITDTVSNTQSFKTGTFKLESTSKSITDTVTLTCNLNSAVTISNEGTDVECTVNTEKTGSFVLSSVNTATSDGNTSISDIRVKQNGKVLIVYATEEDLGAKFLTSFYSLISLILFL